MAAIDPKHLDGERLLCNRSSLTRRAVRDVVHLVEQWHKAVSVVRLNPLLVTHRDEKLNGTPHGAVVRLGQLGRPRRLSVPPAE